MSDTLFSQSYLEFGLPETAEYQQISPQLLAHFGQDLRRPYRDFIRLRASNEAQVEDALLRPILTALGWSYLPQQSVPGAAATPDYTLFLDDDRRAAFTAGLDYQHTAALAEAKAWGADLEQRAGRPRSPNRQVQDYLRQFWQETNGRVKWGILTNGETWRLYRAAGPGPDGKFHRTQDIWLEISLPECVSDDGRAARRLFRLFFHRDAFVVADDGYCFLDRALAGASDYVQTVTETLKVAVFESVYPQLIAAFYAAFPDAEPDAVQESALTLLYRLLFLMYAEDRRMLPAEHPAYATISLRTLRQDILARMQSNPVFLHTYTYWPRLQELFRRLDAGEPAAALPPYNGGLFNPAQPELLAQAQLPDESVARIIDSLGAAAVNGSHDRTLVNFRDLSVRELGTLYESLLERRPVVRHGRAEAQLQPHARKDTGSYYTPPELVQLIIEQALGPLVAERAERFAALSQSLASDTRPLAARRRDLEAADPAQACLLLKVLDPAMGSGHFLVAALDYLTEQIDRLLAPAPELTAWLPDAAPYRSPLQARIENIRAELQRQSDHGGWKLRPDDLSDRAIIRRIVLKRCIYGADLNPMAVELSKMSLWLHSFTVGAPLSFLDHHLRCGDSLVGGWLAQAGADLHAASGGGFANSVFAAAATAAAAIRNLEQINDTDISAVKESAALLDTMEQAVQPLRNMLNFLTGLRWLAAGGSDRPLALRRPPQLRRQLGSDRAAALEWWSVQNFDAQTHLLQRGPDAISADQCAAPNFDFAGFARFRALWQETNSIAAARKMLHWELDFPGVFDGWQPRHGGFDAVIGNPPWDVIKLEEEKWFQPETRRPDIASARPAAHRKAMIEDLVTENVLLYADYQSALLQIDTMRRYGRTCGDYPMLGGGDTNLYRLFVERAESLTDSRGIYALLTPSGIYAEKTSAEYLGKIARNERLLALYDFENRRGGERGRFFPEVHPQLKFCVMTTGGVERTASEVPCGFLLQDRPDNVDPERLLTMRVSDFALVNPDTGTAPVFLNRRDADTVVNIYRNHPTFDAENKNFEKVPAVARHIALAHMTGDSGHFRTREQLESNGWYRVQLNRWRRGTEEMLPLYQGQMIHHFDHRYNSVGVNPDNLHRKYVGRSITDEQHSNARFYAQSPFWVNRDFVQAKFPNNPAYAIGFRDATAATNERTMLATVVPHAGYGHTLPLLICAGAEAQEIFNDVAPLWTANFCSFAFDFIARRKVQSLHMSLYILQQLPVITRAAYNRRFGDITAAELVRDHTLRLCYTAYDLQPFARAQGCDGEPFAWNAAERRHLRARLDALYFILYGISRDDAAYVLDSFPITRQDDAREHNGVYLTKELILGYMNALAAGDTETVLAYAGQSA